MLNYISAQDPESEGQHGVQEEHFPPVLQQGERLGLLTLHDLERGPGPWERVYQGIYTLYNITYKISYTRSDP